MSEEKCTPLAPIINQPIINQQLVPITNKTNLNPQLANKVFVPKWLDFINDAVDDRKMVELLFEQFSQGGRIPRQYYRDEEKRIVDQNEACHMLRFYKMIDPRNKLIWNRPKSIYQVMDEELEEKPDPIEELMSNNRIPLLSKYVIDVLQSILARTYTFNPRPLVAEQATQKGTFLVFEHKRLQLPARIWCLNKKFERSYAWLLAVDKSTAEPDVSLFCPIVLEPTRDELVDINTPDLCLQVYRNLHRAYQDAFDQIFPLPNAYLLEEFGSAKRTKSSNNDYAVPNTLSLASSTNNASSSAVNLFANNQSSSKKGNTSSSTNNTSSSNNQSFNNNTSSSTSQSSNLNVVSNSNVSNSNVPNSNVSNSNVPEAPPLGLKVKKQLESINFERDKLLNKKVWNNGFNNWIFEDVGDDNKYITLDEFVRDYKSIPVFDNQAVRSYSLINPPLTVQWTKFLEFGMRELTPVDELATMSTKAPKVVALSENNSEPLLILTGLFYVFCIPSWKWNFNTFDYMLNCFKLLRIQVLDDFMKKHIEQCALIGDDVYQNPGDLAAPCNNTMSTLNTDYFVENQMNTKQTLPPQVESGAWQLWLKQNLIVVCDMVSDMHGLPEFSVSLQYCGSTPHFQRFSLSWLRKAYNKEAPPVNSASPRKTTQSNLKQHFQNINSSKQPPQVVNNNDKSV